MPNETIGAISNPYTMPIAAAANSFPVTAPGVSTGFSLAVGSPSHDLGGVSVGGGTPTISAGDGNAALNESIDAVDQQYNSPDFSGEGAGEVPQDSDERFMWEEVVAPFEMMQKSNLNSLDYAQTANGGNGPMDDRAFQADVLRASADTIQQIGQFRIISYYQGKINTQKQIFPQSQGSNYSNTYKRMIINSMAAGYTERTQILKSNKALHAYFFNDAPEIITIQGFLKTNAFDPWDMAMLLVWDRLLRGTELARHNAIMELSIADMVYWVYPLSFQYQTQAASQFIASFSMQLLVIDKLIPLAHINEDALVLTTDEEVLYATTNKMVTNDILQGIMTTPENFSLANDAPTEVKTLTETTDSNGGSGYDFGDTPTANDPWFNPNADGSSQSQSILSLPLSPIALPPSEVSTAMTTTGTGR